MLKCWAVGNAVEDMAFRNDVATYFFAEAQTQFWKESVEWAFAEGNASNEIKEFVVEIFMAHMEPGWFKNDSKDWPDVFVREVAEMVFEQSQGKRMTFEEIRRSWMVEREDPEQEENLVDERGKVVEWRDRGIDTPPMIGLPKVKSRRKAEIESSRVHVIERRTERARPKSKESVQGLQAHAARFLRGGR